MISKTAYVQESFRKADDCVTAIKEKVRLGWQVSEVKTCDGGPYYVRFRIDERVDSHP